jgi:hypothetical protein
MRRKKIPIMINNKLKFIILFFCFAASLSGYSGDGIDVTNRPLPTVKAPVPDTPSALPFYVVGNVIDSEAGNTMRSRILFFEAGKPSINIVNLNGESIIELVGKANKFTYRPTLLQAN